MLPEGVDVHALEPHRDERGVFTEVFRREWELGIDPVQWNVVASAPGVLRGVHLHVVHTDHLTVVSGRMVLGLHDVRPGSATEGHASVVELTGDRPSSVLIPTGVAHGFYFRETSLTLYAVSHYWNPSDELGCRWDDPDLRIPWPCTDPTLSERDRHLGSLSELRTVAFRAAARPGGA